MVKFNTATAHAVGRSPLATEQVASTTTYEGHPGYARDARSELFLLAVSNFVNEGSFYESAGDRDARFVALVRKNTLDDPEWTAAFLRWLRAEGHMRSAPLMGAAEFTKARLEAGQHGMSRQVIDSVLQRADEPAEMLAYWMSRHGRSLPMPVIRGVADAILRLGNEMAYLKWNSRRRGFSFADVLNLSHPGDKKAWQRIRAAWQSDLFGYATKVPYVPDTPIPESLGMLTRRAALMAMPVDERRDALEPLRLGAAGMTWEALAGWLQGPMDARAWESIIPNMGVMALIRNLRNFDEAGVSDHVAEQVAARISDPNVIAKSRQLPYRWYSAYQATHSDRWRVALGKALTLSTGNLPELPGRTLILVDTSGSMSGMSFSGRSKVRPVDAAGLFGVALAARCDPDSVDLYGFADGVFPHEVRRGASVLREMERFAQRIGVAGHGTLTARAIANTYRGHDRVIVLTDEQAWGVRRWEGPREVGAEVPPDVPIYAFNLVGYKQGMLPVAPARYQLGGLTDHTFRMIPLLESGKNGAWPWEN